MNYDEYNIERETGNITKISDNKYYKTESGEVKPLANGESEEGKDMVDKITNSEGESEHYTAGSIKESNESSKNKSTFQNADEGKSFYEFAAESSDVEYGAGEVKMQNGGSVVYVGSDHKEGETSFIGMLEKSVGNDLVWASHSHPGSGGPPSYDLRVNGNRIGDLNNAYRSQLNTKYEVYDVPNKLIYTYSKNTYLRAPRGILKPAIYDKVEPKKD